MQVVRLAVLAALAADGPPCDCQDVRPYFRSLLPAHRARACHAHIEQSGRVCTPARNNGTCADPFSSCAWQGSYQSEEPCRTTCSARLNLSPLARQLLDLAEMAITGSLTDEAGSCWASKWEGCDLTKLQPYQGRLRWYGKDWGPYAHAMVGHKRLRNVRAAIESVIADGVEGDFAELGVWRGGVCIFAKLCLDAYGQPARRVHAFDVFGDLPAYGAGKARRNFLSVSEEQVRHNFEKYGLTLDDSIVFHKGLFQQTAREFRLTTPATTRLAVLRIDGNFYESYEDAMYYLYELVPVGGIVIWDDYGSSGSVKRMWKEFRTNYSMPEELHAVDNDGVWWRKTKDVTVDFARKRHQHPLPGSLP